MQLNFLMIWMSFLFFAAKKNRGAKDPRELPLDAGQYCTVHEGIKVIVSGFVSMARAPHQAVRLHRSEYTPGCVVGRAHRFMGWRGFRPFGSHCHGDVKLCVRSAQARSDVDGASANERARADSPGGRMRNGCPLARNVRGRALSQHDIQSACEESTKSMLTLFSLAEVASDHQCHRYRVPRLQSVDLQRVRKSLEKICPRSS